MSGMGAGHATSAPARALARRCLVAYRPALMSRQFRALAILVALGAIAFVVISHRQHDRGAIPGVPVDVLVARKPIRKGTPGDAIRTMNGYAVRNLPQSEVEPGAIVDPGALAGTVAVANIAPGEQLTTAVLVPAR